MLHDAFKAGIWASIGSTLGKLSGSPLTGDSYLIGGFLLILMVLVNTWSCRLYLHSLDASSNSVAPTVISAASSYVLSGIIGVTLLNEGVTVMWWAGTVLIIAGLALVARPRNQQKKIL